MDITNLVAKIILPLSLGVIMLGMGMSLTLPDFTRILKYPKPVFIGLVNQLVFLPIIGFLLAITFNLSPTIAVGLMVLATCPGGATSNLIVQVCKGNIALSVTLTAIASVFSIITIPFILSYVLLYFDNTSNVVIKLPVFDTILQIMVITVIPISIGMLIGKYKINFANRMEKPMNTASIILFMLVFVIVLVSSLEKLVDGLKEAGFVTLMLNIATMALGFFTAKLFKLDFKDTVSITIESGIQNTTLAFVIATSVLNNANLGIPIVAYTVWMFITGGVLMVVLGKRKKNSLHKVKVFC